MSNTRREFLACSLGLGAGALMASCSTKNTSLLGPTMVNADDNIYPWQYHELSATDAAQRAYDTFWDRHCMAAPFEAIVAELGDQYGAPYSNFPFPALKYGAGGIGVSTVCGTLNGSAMAIGLFVEDGADRGALIADLFHWYEQTSLPTFTPPVPKVDSEIVTSTSGSNLCHVSVGKWCDTSNLSAYAPERSERCGRLCADVATKIVTMLNSYFAGTFVPTSPLSEMASSCRGCHDKGGILENTRSNMGCESCHDPHAT